MKKVNLIKYISSIEVCTIIIFVVLHIVQCFYCWKRSGGVNQQNFEVGFLTDSLEFNLSVARTRIDFFAGDRATQQLPLLLNWLDLDKNPDLTESRREMKVFACLEVLHRFVRWVWWPVANFSLFLSYFVIVFKTDMPQTSGDTLGSCTEWHQLWTTKL